MKELTLQAIADLMRFRPTLKETAEWFSVSEDTIERRIRKWEKLTFADFKEKHSRQVKYRLIDRAMDLAMNGNATLMIFCLKNVCGWGDKNSIEDNEIKPIVMAYSLEGLKRAAESNDYDGYYGPLNNYGQKDTNSG